MEDERRLREQEEKKQREMEEKRRRLEEAEKKRQLLEQASKATAGGKIKISKSGDTVRCRDGGGRRRRGTETAGREVDTAERGAETGWCAGLSLN